MNTDSRGIRLRFALVPVVLTCGCRRDEKRWYVEQHMKPGAPASCPKHCAVRVRGTA